MNEDTALLKSMVLDPYIGKWVQQRDDLFNVLYTFRGKSGIEYYRVANLYMGSVTLKSLPCSDIREGHFRYTVVTAPEITPRTQQDLNSIVVNSYRLMDGWIPSAQYL